MSLIKVPLTENDLRILKEKKKSNDKSRLYLFFFLILILLISYLIVGFDLSNETFKFIKIIVIVIISFLILGSLIDTNFENDFKEKIKFIGTVKVRKKEYVYDSEDNLENYILTFDDWRIGVKSVLKEFWNEINEGDEFYIEQASNSGFILKFEKENVDMLNQIVLPFEKIDNK
jgi:hypothetical protein